MQGQLKQSGGQVQLGRDRQLSPGVARVVVKDCEYRVVSLVRPVDRRRVARTLDPRSHTHWAERFEKGDILRCSACECCSGMTARSPIVMVLETPIAQSATESLPLPKRHGYVLIGHNLIVI